MNEQTSSFFLRTLSKEDTVKQFFRPQIAGKITNTLDVLDRLVSEAETLTKLGVELKPGSSATYFVTPDDLKASLSEYGELEQLATEGREFLNKLGYVSRRRLAPLAGTAPVGKVVQVQPVTVRLPGQEPLEGSLVVPVQQTEPENK